MTMLTFDRAQYIGRERECLPAIGETERIVDSLWDKGIRNVFFVGVGGTISSVWRIESILKPLTGLDFHVEMAAELTAMGHKKLGPGSVVFVASASGDTKEIVEAAAYARRLGAAVVAYVGKADAPLDRAADHTVLYPDGGDRYYWYTVAMRLLERGGEYPDYPAFRQALEKLPEALAGVQEQADAFGARFAALYCDEPIHYFTGAGNVWSYTYCYAMCLLEEMLWMRTKSVHAAEFFHGTLEIIERDVPITIFMGEDDARPLAQRVADFVPRISAKVTVVDSKDYALPGIPDTLRGLFAPEVIRAVCARVTAHLEDKRKHPTAIRRYYRQLDY